MKKNTLNIAIVTISLALASCSTTTVDQVELQEEPIVFSRNIKVDKKHPLKVFIQLEGDCNGVYVTAKSKNGFEVKELANGNSNVAFSWQIVATRADSKDLNGEILSNYENLRFPYGPEPKQAPKQEPKQAPKRSPTTTETKPKQARPVQ